MERKDVQVASDRSRRASLIYDRHHGLILHRLTGSHRLLASCVEEKEVVVLKRPRTGKVFGLDEGLERTGGCPTSRIQLVLQYWSNKFSWWVRSTGLLKRYEYTRHEYFRL
jgi:hypothetical protein